MRLTRTESRGSIALLAAGDVLALLLFIGVGLQNHNMTDNVVAAVARIAAPFLIGWFVAALALGAYSPGLVRNPGAFMLRSVLAWAVGMAVGLLLRNTVFGSDFSPVFAIITFVFTAIFLLGWRAAFTWLTNRR